MKRLLTVLLLFPIAGLYAAQQSTRSAAVADRGLKPSDFPQLKKLLDNVYVFSDLHTLGYMTNDLIVITTDGVLVADGQASPAVTGKLVDQIARLTPQPIKYVVICSDHGDHTGGNSAFPETTTFISHPFTQAILEKQASNPRPNAPKTRVPTETVTAERTIKMGNTEIRILFSGRSHAGGDLQVYLPQEKVAFMSETFSNHIFPSMRTAQPIEWMTTLKNVARLDADFVIPGHGFIEDPVTMKMEFAAFSKAVEYVVAEATRLHKLGLTPDAASKQANWGIYETWTSKDRNAPIAIQRVYDALDGKLR
jgi:cyclase